MKRKKVIGIIVLVASIFLTACSFNQQDLTENWNEMAATQAFSLDSSDGFQIRFNEEGMDVNNINQAETPFPFEESALYEDYQVIQEDEQLIISTENDWKYQLTIAGPRSFIDEENKVSYQTVPYLIKYEE